MSYTAAVLNTFHTCARTFAYRNAMYIIYLFILVQVTSAMRLIQRSKNTIVHLGGSLPIRSPLIPKRSAANIIIVFCSDLSEHF